MLGFTAQHRIRTGSCMKGAKIKKSATLMADYNSGGPLYLELDLLYFYVGT